MLDIACNRYAGKRPSVFLGIKDQWSAYQVDTALAVRGQRSDREFMISLVDGLRDDIHNFMRMFGAKFKEKKGLPPRNELQSKEPKPVEEILAAIGGKGSVIEYGRHN